MVVQITAYNGPNTILLREYLTRINAQGTFELISSGNKLTDLDGNILPPRFKISPVPLDFDLNNSRKIILACVCVADTQYNTGCGKKTRTGQIFTNGDILTLPRTLWMRHNPSEKRIIESSLLGVFDQPPGYGIPLIWNPEKLAKQWNNIHQIFVGWSRADRSVDVQPKEAHVFNPDDNDSCYLRLNKPLEPVAPAGLDSLVNSVRRIYSSLSFFLEQD